MFALRYFPAHFFAPRYWDEGPPAVVVPVGRLAVVITVEAPVAKITLK